MLYPRFSSRFEAEMLSCFTFLSSLFLLFSIYSSSDGAGRGVGGRYIPLLIWVPHFDLKDIRSLGQGYHLLY